MPTGDGAMYWKDGARFRALCYPHDSVRRTDSEEGLVAQYLALAWRDPAELVAVRSDFHAGSGQVQAGPNWRHKVDIALFYKGGRVALCQYHGFTHYKGHSAGCPFENEHEPYEENEETTKADARLRDYAAALNEACRGWLNFEVHVFTSCDFFHSREVKTHDGEVFSDLRELLRSPRYLPDSVVRPEPASRWRPTEPQLLKHLLTDDEAGGLVCIQGGFETRRDQASLQEAFSFGRFELLPKCKTEGEPEAGDLLGHYAAETVGEERLAKEIRGRTLTGVRQRYGDDKLTVMSVQMLRIMVELRGLRSFKIVHYIRYSLRDYNASFIAGLLKLRHKIKMEGGDSLSGQIFKLMINSNYGYYSISPPRYPRSRVVASGSLRNMRPRGDTLSLTLLGSKLVGRTGAGFLYGFTYKDPDAKIMNCSHLGASILSYSKICFLSSIMFLSSVLDLRKAQGAYKDTDSYILYLARKDLKECVRPGFEDVFERFCDSVLDDEEVGGDGARLQTLRLKREGDFSKGLFANMKAYYLEHEDPLEEPMKRSKGLPEKSRKSTTDSHYREGGGGGEVLSAAWSLAPTSSMELGMSIKSRKLPPVRNYKRFTVSSSQTYPLHR